MQLNSTLRNGFFFAATALSLSAVSSAQSVLSEGVFWGESFGGSSAGASFGAGASTMYMDLDLGSVGQQHFGTAQASVDADASLFGWNLEVFHFGASAAVNAMTWAPGASSATLDAEARILGFTVYEAEEGGTALETTIPIPPYVIIEKSKTFTVGPIPVTVQGGLALGSELGLAADVNVYDRTVMLVPSIRGWVMGGAAVSLGSELLGAGVEATMRVADTTLAYVMVTDVDDRSIYGYLRTTIVPLSIEIEVFVQILFARPSLTVYEWAMDAMDFYTYFN